MSIQDILVTNKTRRLPTDYRKHAAVPRGPNQYEEGFWRLWCIQFPDLPKPEREYRFHDTRKWRLDFAWPDIQCGVEIDGVVHGMKGMRNRDAEKGRALLDWHILHWTSEEMKSDPLGCIETTAAVVKKLMDAKEPAS
jgi:very-short-patch-repair endonuclease